MADRPTNTDPMLGIDARLPFGSCPNLSGLPTKPKKATHGAL
jgi:hypothetical protein